MKRLASAAGPFVPAHGRAAANAVFIAAIVWISAVRYQQYPKVPYNVGREQMQIFDRLEPAPKAVFLDQYNLILFYIFHQMWTWKSVEPPQPIPDTDVYRLRRGAEEMVVFRDKTDWNIDPTDPAVFARLAACAHGKAPGDFRIQPAPVSAARALCRCEAGAPHAGERR